MHNSRKNAKKSAWKKILIISVLLMCAAGSVAVAGGPEVTRDSLNTPEINLPSI
jgi:hypothetical protein